MIRVLIVDQEHNYSWDIRLDSDALPMPGEYLTLCCEGYGNEAIDYKVISRMSMWYEKGPNPQMVGRFPTMSVQVQLNVRQLRDLRRGAKQDK